MLPNVFPAAVIFGWMGWTDRIVDIGSMMTASVAMGIAVDDTVHFFHNYAKYRNLGKSVKESVDETMLGTGRAMVATTIVLSLGFFVYMFASLSNLVNFGILTGGAIIIALISDIVLAPALLKLMSKEK